MERAVGVHTQGGIATFALLSEKVRDVERGHKPICLADEFEPDVRLA